MRECLVCCEQKEIFAFGKCGHFNVCYLCTYKMRVKLENIKCVECNAELRQVIMARDIPLKQQTKDMPGGESGIYFYDNDIHGECDDTEKFKCIVKNCKDAKQDFTSMVLLKKHLKTAHNRQFCDICLKSNTSVLHEQRLFNPSDLKNHLKKGDLDKEGNVYFSHPFCFFCKEHYFNDDIFAGHLRSKHFKCDLCHPVHQNICYNNYQNLAQHHQQSHYACKRAECLEKCFVVFKEKEELEDHTYKTHGEYISIKKNTALETGRDFKGPNKILDREGVDMSTQFLSLKKKLKTKFEDEKEFDYRFDLREFLNIDREPPQRKQGVKPAKNPGGKTGGKGRGRGGYKHKNVKNDDQGKEESEFPDDYVEEYDTPFGPEVTIENLMLPSMAAIPQMDFEEFKEYNLTFMCKNDLDVLLKKINQYKTKKIYAQDLFETYEELIGRRNAFLVFSHLVKVMENPKTGEDLEEELFHQALQLRSTMDCILKDNKTYVQFFVKLRNKFTENIFKRFQAGLLNEENPCKKDPNILFQFIGCIKAMHYKEILKFKYLSNFLESQNAVDIIKKSLFIFNKKIDDRFSEIPNTDILCCFMYFNLAVSRFEDKVILNQKSQINPNLNKLFLRHYPEFAQKMGLELESERKDFIIPVKPPVSHDELTLKDFKNDRKMLKNTFDQNFSLNVVDVFALDKNLVSSHKLNDEDLTNRYEFPDMDGKDLEEAFAAPVKVQQSKLSVEDRKLRNRTGWDRTDLYVYNNKKISKMEEEELFPSLSDWAGAIPKKLTSGAQIKTNSTDSRANNGMNTINKEEDGFLDLNKAQSTEKPHQTGGKKGKNNKKNKKGKAIDLF